MRFGWFGDWRARVLFHMESMDTASIVIDRAQWYYVPTRCAAGAFQTVRPAASLRDILALCADVLELRAWRKMSLTGCFMAAAYAAVLLRPLVYGSLGSSIVALMTPVK
jgi:hypothetical protein